MAALQRDGGSYSSIPTLAAENRPMHSASHGFRGLLGLVPLSTLLLNVFVAWRSYRDSCEEVSRRSSSFSCLHVHSATASVQELRPSALRSELAFRALRVSDSSPLASSGSLSKNVFSWQRSYAATWEQRTFAPFGMCPD